MNFDLQLSVTSYLIALLVGGVVLTLQFLLRRTTPPQSLPEYIRQARDVFYAWFIGGCLIFSTVWYVKDFTSAVNISPFLIGFAFSRAFGGGWQNKRSRWQTAVAALLVFILTYVFYTRFWQQAQRYAVYYFLIAVIFDMAIRGFNKVFA